MFEHRESGGDNRYDKSDYGESKGINYFLTYIFYVTSLTITF